MIRYFIHYKFVPHGYGTVEIERKTPIRCLADFDPIKAEIREMLEKDGIKVEQHIIIVNWRRFED